MSDQIPKRRRIALGIFWGLIATFAWAGYNVAAKIGRLEGFSPADLTMLRCGGGALFFLAFMFGGSGGARLSFRKTLLSACIIGPGFGMIVNTAFGLAPLSHAVIIGPGAAMIVGNLLPVFLDHKILQPTRWIGMAILFAGLFVIGFHRQESVDQSGDWVWLGDLGFVATGALWAVFWASIGQMESQCLQRRGASCNFIRIFVRTALLFVFRPSPGSPIKLGDPGFLSRRIRTVLGPGRLCLDHCTVGTSACKPAPCIRAVFRNFTRNTFDRSFSVPS